MTSINKWSDEEAQRAINKYAKQGFSEELALRTYSARLLGNDPELVLHGGGNTSAKSENIDLFGNVEPIIYIKGSGWDLGSIEPQGHPAVKLEPLRQLQNIVELSDEEMVSIQRRNLLDPTAPTPSVEALLHAFLPYKYIDHTHSISILALANQPEGMKVCHEIFGKSMVIVPYIMPGFNLALESLKIYKKEENKSISLGYELEGMLLLNHGLFTFGKTAKESYERMIKLVNKAESCLSRKISLNLNQENDIVIKTNYLKTLPILRGLLNQNSAISDKSTKWVIDIRSNRSILNFIKRKDLKDLIYRGVATPDHVIRTKSKPLLLKSLNSFNKKIDYKENLIDWALDSSNRLEEYKENYEKYFNENNIRLGGIKKKLDSLPRVVLHPDIGLIAIGKNKKDAVINGDIAQAWLETLLSAESFGSFLPVNAEDTFDLEYWSLEQAKLGKKKSLEFHGNVVAITGAGGAIGSEIARIFATQGAEVIVIDKDFESAQKTAKSCGFYALPIACDLTNPKDIKKAFDIILSHHGGLDILISNAGSAWEGDISILNEDVLMKSIDINLLSHQRVTQKAVEIFKLQDLIIKANSNKIGGQLLFNISKQSLNPGKGFGSYGIAKAALLALMRQYALEEGICKIRSNGINADRIQSGLLNDQMIESRAVSRGVSKEEYMEGNLLKKEVKAEDVAEAFLSIAKMKSTTGALLTVDGGNVSAMVR